MKRQINSAKRIVSQTAKVSAVGVHNAVSKIKHTGCETISNTASTVKSQICSPVLAWTAPLPN